MTSKRLFTEAPAFRPLRRDVYEALRRAILLGQLAPGERVIEAELARQMQISRGPVREALRQLEQDGMVEYRPRRGVVVAALSRDRVFNTYAVRAELEGLAARLAADRVTAADVEALEKALDTMRAEAAAGNDIALLQADVAFHELICRIADNPVLLKSWRALGPLSWTLFSGAKQAGEYELTELAERHQELLDAIVSGDPEAAGDAGRAHTLGVARIVVEALDRPVAEDGDPMPSR